MYSDIPAHPGPMPSSYESEKQISPSLVQVRIEAAREAMRRAVKAAAATARTYARRRLVQPHSFQQQPADVGLDVTVGLDGAVDLGSGVVEQRFAPPRSKVHGCLGFVRYRRLWLAGEVAVPIEAEAWASSLDVRLAPLPREQKRPPTAIYEFSISVAA